MDPRRLLIFRAVARTGSIGAAARTLGWTQPAVSQHVRALERETGNPLVVRGARGTALTEAGRQLLARADALAAVLHMAEEEQAAFAQLRRGTVRLAAYPSAAATTVPPAVARLRRAHPGTEVRLVEAEPPEALALLRAADVDLAVVFDHDDVAAGAPLELRSRPLAEEPLHLLLPPGHRLHDASAVDVEDLADETWIAGCARCRSHLLRRCARAGYRPRVEHTTDDYVVVQNLVAAGLGVALLPDGALRAYRHAGVVLRSGPQWGTRTTSVAYRDGADAVPANAALLRELGAPVTGAGRADQP